MTASSPCFTAIDLLSRQPFGVRLRVKLSPKASANRIDRIELDETGAARLRLSVTAVAEKGKANKAMIALLARNLGLVRSQITISAGTTTQIKTIDITGDPPDLAERITKALHQQGIWI
ncbi:UPF0235 protein [Iodidimonas nitroreducens]|uniref:UPF0235 protein JCM17846_18030 n=1 Tax=Iodidimonas nitroreducens TaxID=1236968 RepID=A0A5A7N741_9PROT|nr:DUF167 family protein [Iodidimonas nitroreducens]GAK33292.1 hypothetical protein AQ1_01180 [alpha proteobacterium Q-1]GER04121.1 UPF0235 protein [Iodidimonas nitroreducens]